MTRTLICCIAIFLVAACGADGPPEPVGAWGMFRATRDLWGDFPEEAKPLMTARTHLLQETIFWMPVWPDRVSITVAHLTGWFFRLGTLTRKRPGT